MKQFIDDMRLNGFNQAYLDITESKVSHFVYSMLNDSNREKRVKMAYAALRMNYEQNMEYLKRNIICLTNVADSANKKIFDKILEILRSETESPNWTDAEVVLEAHEAGLIYPDLVFVTADYNDILRHRKELLSVTVLYDIVPLFET